MPTNEEKLSSVQPTQDEVASDNQEKTEVEAPVNTLKAIGLKKRYGSRWVVQDVSLEVKSGEVVGLLGPNGAGKTTTFNMVVGLVVSDGGSIELNGQSIAHLPIYKRSRLGVSYLPQEASVFRRMTVEENIRAILELQQDENGKSYSKAEIDKKLDDLLDELQITRLRTNTAMSLSGGERRRTEIARALAAEPKFILLDEPFAGVVPIAVEDIQSIVIKLKEKNIGILITDHNVQETLCITDRAYLLYDGRILQSGSAEDLANDPEVRRVYLGKNFELRRKK